MPKLTKHLTRERTELTVLMSPEQRQSLIAESKTIATVRRAPRSIGRNAWEAANTSKWNMVR